MKKRRPPYWGAAGGETSLQSLISRQGTREVLSRQVPPSSAEIHLALRQFCAERRERFQASGRRLARAPEVDLNEARHILLELQRVDDTDLYLDEVERLIARGAA